VREIKREGESLQTQTLKSAEEVGAGSGGQATKETAEKVSPGGSTEEATEETVAADKTAEEAVRDDGRELVELRAGEGRTEEVVELRRRRRLTKNAGELADLGAREGREGLWKEKFSDGRREDEEGKRTVPPRRESMTEMRSA
jgi:hypothetical protein